MAQDNGPQVTSTDDKEESEQKRELSYGKSLNVCGVIAKPPRTFIGAFTAGFRCKQE